MPYLKNEGCIFKRVSANGAKRYLLEVFDGQFGVHGPFRTEARRLAFAKRIKSETSGDSECHRLTIDRTGKASVEIIPDKELS